MPDPSVDYSADFGAQPPRGETRFVTAGGIEVTRTATPFDPAVLADVTRQIDARRGGTFSSGMEYPGRYSRWHMGYVDPCVEFAARGRELTATALNERGAVLLPAIGAALDRAGTRLSPTAMGQPEDAAASVRVVIAETAGVVPEEERSRRPTVFSAIREVIALFAGPDEHLGLYGAFGYDLAFQFEPIRQRPERHDNGAGAAGTAARPGAAPARPDLRDRQEARDRAAVQLRVRRRRPVDAGTGPRHPASRAGQPGRDQRGEPG